VSVTDKIEKSPAEAALHEWRHVPVGAVVRLKSGVWWVLARSGDRITMRNARSGQESTGSPPPGNMVTILQPGDTLYVAPPELAAAEQRVAGLSEAAQGQLASALVQVMLGAHVVAERDLDDPTAPANCPDVRTMAPHHLAAHLHLFHALADDDPVNLAAPGDPAVLHALHESRRAATPHRHH
jgi:hypothetical protein